MFIPFELEGLLMKCAAQGTYLRGVCRKSIVSRGLFMGRSVPDPIVWNGDTYGIRRRCLPRAIAGSVRFQMETATGMQMETDGDAKISVHRGQRRRRALIMFSDNHPVLSKVALGKEAPY